MLKKEKLVAEIAEKADTTKVEARKHLELALTCMADALAKGDSVDLPGFGRFTVKNVLQKEGRNPQTGEKLIIPEYKKVKFAPSKTLKDKVNG